MTSDEISRSRRYNVSRTRNALIKARDAIWVLGTLDYDDLIQIDRRIFEVVQNIRDLIEQLEAIQPAAKKKARAKPTLRGNA